MQAEMAVRKAEIELRSREVAKLYDKVFFAIQLSHILTSGADAETAPVFAGDGKTQLGHRWLGDGEFVCAQQFIQAVRVTAL